MAKNTHIEWTHHTFNPWWGCVKVSPACDNCYAELWAKRMGHKVWGAKSPRRFFTDAHWKEPLTWNEEAKESGVRQRVFCASMADVFENRPELIESRVRLWKLIAATPHLDWLLLTKRPQNIEKMVPWTSEWPSNIWLGTTVENQEWAEKRIPFLVKHAAAVRFLSCEPLLGPLDLSRWKSEKNPINWVIAGGESGHGARPMHPLWAEGLLNQCKKYKVAFHFKQWGHWAPASQEPETKRARRVIEENHVSVEMVALGKTASGRMLAGATWDGLPTQQELVYAKR